MAGDPLAFSAGRQVAAVLHAEADVAEHGEPGKRGIGLEHHALRAARPLDRPAVEAHLAAWWASRARRPCASRWSCRSRRGRRRRRTRLRRCRASSGATTGDRPGHAVGERLGQPRNCDEAGLLANAALSQIAEPAPVQEADRLVGDEADDADGQDAGEHLGRLAVAPRRPELDSRCRSWRRRSRPRSDRSSTSRA